MIEGEEGRVRRKHRFANGKSEGLSLMQVEECEGLASGKSSFTDRCGD